MKKSVLVLIAIMMATGSLFAHQTNISLSSRTNKNVIAISDSNSGLVFRGTQRVRANDGSEIYFYSNGNMQMYAKSGRLEAEGTYEWDGKNEIFIKDNYGRVIYKASCKVDQQKQLVSITLSGQTYWKKS